MCAAEVPTIPWLVQRWRTDVARQTARQTAARLAVSPAALSQWETGTKRLPYERLQQLDETYAAQGLLIDMAHGIAALQTLPPRRTWDFNPSPTKKGVWVWILSGSEETISGRASQAFFYVRVDNAGANTGTLLFLDESVPNPAIRVDLDSPGWVAFGHGRPPQGLGIDLIDVRSDSDWGLLDHPLMRRTFNWLRSSSGRAALHEWAERAGRPLSEIANAYKNVRIDPANKEIPDVRLGQQSEQQRRVTLENARALRRELGLTQKDLAEAVTVLRPGQAITDDHIGRFEAGRGANDERLLLAARIDTLLRLDGSLALTQVAVCTTGSHKAQLVHFPDFWVGPVWAQFMHPGDRPAVYELTWPPYTTRLRASRGEIGYFRQSVVGQQPLRIRGPRTGKVILGVGYHPDGFDINHLGWDLGPRFLMTAAWDVAARIVTRPRRR